MEAGLIALLLLFGYVAVDETSETKESTEKIIVNEKQIDFDYQVIGNVEQRFFKNNYQLQIKQFHYDSQVKYIDAITNLSINSADLLNYTTSFIDEIDNGEKYRNEFKVKAQLLPKTNNEFDFGYVFNHLEYSLDSSKKDYEMTLEDRMSLYTNKVFTIKYKNNQYELKLKDLGYSETFKNVENLNCKKEVVCEILKENTIKYKEVKGLKSV